MTTKQQIQEWLQQERPNYDEGLALLRPNTANRGLLLTLSKKENTFNWQKLRYELEKVVAALPDAEQPAQLTDAGAVDAPPHNTQSAGAGNPGEPAGQPFTPGDQQPGATGADQAQPTPPGSGGMVVEGTLETAAGIGHGEQLPGSGLPPAVDQSRGMNTDGLLWDFNPANAPTLGGQPVQVIFPLGLPPQDLLQGQPVALAGQPVTRELPGHLLINGAGEIVGASEEVQQALQQAREQLPKLAERIAQHVAEKGTEVASEVLQALEKLTVQASQVYVEKARLSNSLRGLATDQERRAVVENIEALQGKLDQLNTQKEYILQNNRLPEEAAPAAQQAPPDRDQLTRDRNNLRSQVSKARSRLNQKPTDVLRQQKLAKLEADLEQVENTLKTLEA